MTFLRYILAGVVGFYLLIAVAAWAGQRYLIYFPDPQKVDPSSIGLQGVEVRTLAAADGVHVLAWFARAKPGQPTLLYFHGNGGNLAQRGERIRRFTSQGVGVYMMSYRGYGGSGGVPSEKANVADARLAYADLRQLGVATKDIVIYGESLGTGIATQLALDSPAAGLILDAPFTSIVEIGASRYPLLPVNWLLTDRYDTLSIIGKVRLPLLVVHGEADRVVPVEMGRRVFAAAVDAAQPKRLLVIPGAGHGNHMRYGSFEAIMAFIEELGRR